MSLATSRNYVVLAIAILVFAALVLAISLTSSGRGAINRVIPGPVPAQAAPSGNHGPVDADGDRDVRKNGAYNPKFSDGDSDDPA
jgi:hypothetical protein